MNHGRHGNRRTEVLILRIPGERSTPKSGRPANARLHKVPYWFETARTAGGYVSKVTDTAQAGYAESERRWQGRQAGDSMELGQAGCLRMLHRGRDGQAQAGRITGVECPIVNRPAANFSIQSVGLNPMSVDYRTVHLCSRNETGCILGPRKPAKIKTPIFSPSRPKGCFRIFPQKANSSTKQKAYHETNFYRTGSRSSLDPISSRQRWKS